MDITLKGKGTEIGVAFDRCTDFFGYTSLLRESIAKEDLRLAGASVAKLFNAKISSRLMKCHEKEPQRYNLGSFQPPVLDSTFCTLFKSSLQNSIKVKFESKKFDNFVGKRQIDVSLPRGFKGAVLTDQDDTTIVLVPVDIGFRDLLLLLQSVISTLVIERTKTFSKSTLEKIEVTKLESILSLGEANQVPNGKRENRHHKQRVSIPVFFQGQFFDATAIVV